MKSKFINFLADLKKRPKKQKLKFVISRILIFLNINKFVNIQRDGYILSYSTNNIASEMFIQGRKFYNAEEKFINSFLRTDSVFIDVGANIGNISLAASTIISDGEIHAIEANFNTFRQLNRNVHINMREHRISTYNLAILDKPGTALISDSFADDQNKIIDNTHDSSLLEVESTSLDVLLKKIHKVDFIKIDIEGCELDCLKGSVETLSKTKYVYFEVWDKLTNRYGHKGKDVITFLNINGFKVYEVINFKVGKECIKKEFPEICMCFAISQNL